MAKLAMKRIEIAALLSDRKNIMELLQRLGLVEFSDCCNEALVKMNTNSYVSQFEKNIVLAIKAKEILDEYSPAKKSFFSALNGKREIEKGDFKSFSEKSGEYLKYCEDLNNYKKIITEDNAAAVRTQTLMDALKIWLDLDIPMKYKGTEYTNCFIGVIPKQKTAEDILSEIAVINPELEMLDAEVISSFKEQTCVAVICHKEESAAVNEALREIGFVYPSEQTDCEPGERMRQYGEELEKLSGEISENIKKIESYADKKEKIEFLIDYLTVRKEKYSALNKIGLTKNTFIISGYIPAKYSNKCTEEIEKNYIAAINITEPEEEEDVPVLLENGEFASPVESITEMYALPAKKDVDPSPVMALFYYLFFGMMLSDAGYGALMVIGSLIVLKKFNVEGSMKKTLKMFFYCGISTVFWGAMFGSWFGDIAQVVGKQFFNTDVPSLALWFEPIKDPMKLLLFSFLLGIIHLFVGLGVSFKMAWDDGRKADAFFDTVPIYLMVLGAAPLAAGVLISVPQAIAAVGKYLALTGTALIILTSGRGSKNIFAKLGGGLYGFYNIASGYLSDVLSYSRLLALGLATGSIASVINLMGTMMNNVYLKAILLIVVFLVGHPLNMAVNFLGAYVHSNRLQFVELFSKFYEGGGRAFNPLKVNTKYIKFKEDINNG